MRTQSGGRSVGIRGVIFDFNGTLFWDTALHNRAWDTFLARHDLHLTDEEKHRSLHGKNNRDILTSLFGTALTDGQIQTMVREKETLYQKFCLDTHMTLAPGAEEFLGFLAESGIRHTIATASGIENVTFYMKWLKLSRWFAADDIIYNDGSIPGKPDPEIFLTAMRRMQIGGPDVVIFEDSITGIIAAERSGAGTIIIVNSTGADYGAAGHPVITDFSRVERSLFLSSH